MSGLKFIAEAVVSRVTGKLVPARLVICSNCNESKFVVFIVGKNHQHLQCAHCDETYCDGSCDKEK